MLVLKRIQPVNMFSFGEVPVLELDYPGLTLVRGKNGTGKSSLFNSITTCLFENNPKGLIKDDVVNDALRKGCGGVLSFVKDNTGFEYLIGYNRKGGAFATELIFQKRDASGKITDLRGSDWYGTLKQIQVTTGVSYEQFMNISYLSQGKAGSFLTGTNKDRFDIITGLLNLEPLDRAVQMAKDQLKALLAKTLELETAVGKGTAQAAIVVVFSESEQKQHEQELLSKKQQIADAQAELLGLNNSALGVENRLASSTESLLQLQGEMLKLESAMQLSKTKLESELVSISDKRKANTDLLSELQLHRVVLDTSSILTRDLEKEIAGLNELVVSCNIDSLRVCLKDSGETLISVRAELMSRRKEESDVRVKLEQMLSGAGVTCDKCGSVVSADALAKHKSELQGQLIVIADAILALESEQDYLNKVVASNQAAIESYEVKLGEYNAAVARLRSEEAEAARVREHVSKREAFLVDASVFDARDLEVRNELFNLITTYNSNLGVLREKWDQINQDVASYKQTLGRINSSKGVLSDKISSLNAAAGNLEFILANNVKNVELVRGLQQETQRLQLELAQVREQVGYYAVLASTLGNAGLKSYKVETVVSLLNQHLQKYLEMLTGGRVQLWGDLQKQKKSAKSDEDQFVREFMMYIKSGKKEKVKVEGYSGGELGILTLALTLAFFDIAQSATSLGVNVLMLDEIFAPLDESNKEVVLKVLNYMRGLGRSVYVTSHIPVENYLEFDRVITMEKSGDVSTYTVSRG